MKRLHPRLVKSTHEISATSDDSDSHADTYPTGIRSANRNQSGHIITLR